CDKRYRAALKFGEETDTLDPEGRIVAEAPPPGREDLEGVLPSFTGEILQSPPEYSAVHVNGRRAHELARRGIAVEMKKRKVTVYDLRLLKWDPPFAEIEVFCSKGTYIRSLARDIALALSSRAHLVSLTRTVVGGFSLEKALTLDGPEGLEGELKPIDRELFSLLGIPGLIIDRETASSVARGFPLRYLAERLPLPEGALSAALFGPSEDSEPYFAGIIEKRGGLWKYGYVNADP
ncbi:MAG: tRNA pseudouridine(55) synthase TruB, partial [Treponema sp.]|nr:tRNA pseudouridine(55) synthase TruB [Treponema sp.]